ncbi:DUF1990 domain-containing protein [Microbacterium hominis]|uniref:DUF1990 domain-containing protein n=1 Tax=Microbacterium hominis TaxID=162426 RepID=A0A134DJP3_9MICO|nr:MULTISPECIES: DUF1990 family protein [Microbacterium]AUG29764.1 DUF1990 domain-containing protein [Microbacterium hominis]KXC06760.1 hypothetical protein MhomT_03945 [Microbacterium hominis]QOC25476.1 DUF1990 domain-containing protein [Microbacterium hominis]QOC29484.1 DUF1990 domain-containing protein [Microbacterium hominis]QRY41067.1 DUF1990 domain-containing protein [Microbacterium hominis]
MRRGSFQDDTVDYAAVGATQAHDLMSYPPENSVPAEDSLLLGSGQARFESSAEALLSWSALRGAGLQISDVRPAAGPMYTGVGYDIDGTPTVASRLEADQRFDADGTPYVAAGTTIRVHGHVKRMSADGELRVIYAIEEPRRVGFALGTVGGSVVSGEESFVVTWADNDEVRFTVRAFDRPVSALYRLIPPLLKRRRRELFRGYLRAISPMYTTPA